jgi:hypothetical protein
MNLGGLAVQVTAAEIARAANAGIEFLFFKRGLTKAEVSYTIPQ